MRHRAPGAVCTSVELRVPFHDVDPLLVVWHGHYYKYFEIARTELLRSRGIDVPALFDLGFKLFVIESRCRYVQPLRYDERFVVDAWFCDIDHRIQIAYEIRSLNTQRRVARGTTALVTTNADGVMLLEVPDAIRAKIVP
jgi:acyl-CoA thioester hydrolase